MTHVLIDFAVEPDVARERWTLDDVGRFLDAAVEVTGLSAFGPQVRQANGDILMGLQMIAESHVSVHLDRAHGKGWADVFSCRYVSAGKVSAVVDQCFGGWQSIEILERGILPQKGGSP